MLTSPGFGSLPCIVSELRLFCAHELCVSCPRVFPEEDIVKSGVAHILESHPREQHAKRGTLYMEVAYKRPKRERAGHPPSRQARNEDVHAKRQMARPLSFVVGCAGNNWRGGH